MCPAVPAASPRVVAVVVAHNGERWLPRLTSALEAATVLPTALVAVDTSSTDASAEMLAAAFGADQVHQAPSRFGFGEAVASALTAGAGEGPADAEEWVWLLHDDCAPAADALEQLLAVAAADDRIGVVGCRVRSWPRGRRLLEVGVAITGSGHRETGLEAGEYDQGQYDEVRDVLAVSSAGMLVRRRVWDELGGFDRRLPLFRDDVDFCWRAVRSGHRVLVAPDAVLFHAEAATREARQVDCVRGSQHRVDRQAALFTLLANCSAWALAPMYPRLLLGSLLRALGYLVGKLPAAALDEVVAMVTVLGRPWRLMAARRRVRTAIPRRRVRPLLPPWWTPYAHGIDLVAGRAARAVRGTSASVASSARRLRSSGNPAALETGPVPDEAVNLPTGPGPVAWMVAHPGMSLVAALVVASLVAGRGLWGAGFLQGGALLPAPDGAGDWWRLYLQSHHPVGLGSSAGAAPYVALLGLLGGVLVGKAWLAVDVLMLFAVPIGAWGAYLAAGRLVGTLLARLWMALAYAVVVVVTGSVTTGHIGTVVAALALPWLVLGASTIGDPARRGWWRAGWATGLALGVMAAFAPLAWPMAAVAGLAGSWLLVRSGMTRRIGAVAVSLGVPFLLLMPWSFAVATDPTRWLDEAGAVDRPGPSVSGAGWHLLLGRLGAAGAAPLWLTCGLTVAALVSLLRADRRSRVAGAWAVMAIGLVAAAAVAHHDVTPPGSTQQAHAWFGLPVVVAVGAMVAAAGLASDGLRRWIQTAVFGWRQPLAALTLAAALATPLAALAWWVGVAPHGELRRTDPVALPAYMTAAMAAGGRVLVVDATGAPITYRILAGGGLRLGDETVLPKGRPADLDGLVSRLLSGARPADVPRLAALGVRYVVLQAPAAPADVAELDGTAGLGRSSSVTGVFVGWQLSTADPAGSAESGAGAARTWWLAGQLGCWIVVIVMAAPGIRPRLEPAGEAA